MFKYFKDKRTGKFITALDGIDLSLDKGVIIAVIGESGSGKTTLGRITTGLETISKGTVLIDGKPIEKYKGNALWKKVQYIHQDPYSALDPYLRIKDVLQRPLRNLLHIGEMRELESITDNIINQIGLESTYLEKRSEQLSGGEKQRILVGRAFIVNPEYVVADEPTTMVDAINRNQVLAAISKMVNLTGASVMLITHDISIAFYISDLVAIMFGGIILEIGTKDSIMNRPMHPYTQRLNEASAENLVRNQNIEHDILNINFERRSVGCRYAPFCKFAMDKCWSEVPKLDEVSQSHRVACFLYN